MPLPQWKNIDPQRMKHLFYLSQVAVGAALVFFLWRLRNPRVSDSGFRDSTSDSSQAPTKANPDPVKPEAVHSGVQKKASPRPLLPGISLEWPAEEILGVSPQASEIEIQRAYRERMKQYHPDKVGPPDSHPWKEAQKIAVAIQHARDELLARKKTKV